MKLRVVSSAAASGLYMGTAADDQVGAVDRIMDIVALRRYQRRAVKEGLGQRWQGHFSAVFRRTEDRDAVKSLLFGDNA